MSQSKTEVKTLLEAGAHFGHRTSRWNPGMQEFIYDRRGGIHIIDLVQTAERLQAAAEFAESVATSGKQILFVGTKKHIAPAVEEAARQVEMPYVTGRWFGGILTNFNTISQRIKHFKKLTDDLSGGELEDTYIKREIQEFEEEREKLAESFGGMANMEQLPGALFVTDVVTEKTAVAEANRLGIPVIGIVDTNADPEPIDYPVPANDDAVKTVRMVAEQVASAIADGVKSYNKKSANTEAGDAKPGNATVAKTSAKRDSAPEQPGSGVSKSSAAKTEMAEEKKKEE